MEPIESVVEKFRKIEAIVVKLYGEIPAELKEAFTEIKQVLAAEPVEKPAERPSSGPPAA